MLVSSKPQNIASARELKAPAVLWCALKTMVAVFLICAVSAIAAPAQTFTTLVNFDGTDGAAPMYGSLVQGTDGRLYGTTAGGGSNARGTVFKMTPGGVLTTLYNFCSLPKCADGSAPSAGLVLGTDGNFYGTTASTIFKISPTGALTTLASGLSGPISQLIQASDGNFYGSFPRGGTFYDEGAIFKITPTGVLTTLYNFHQTDGAWPYAGLVEGTDGNFYGTTVSGGDFHSSLLCPNDGCGTVFKITPAGVLTTLHFFQKTPDGLSPYGTLVQGTDGNFYGTTFGGMEIGGTVFEITPGGALTTLYQFSDNLYDGVIIGTDGNLYGTTNPRSDAESGNIFELTPEGVPTILYNFVGGISDPNAGLMQFTNGTFYGTTTAGGTSKDGTIFSLSNGLGPFVITNPVSGVVGKKVTILGTNLMGATGVSFNGTAATFTVQDSAIDTTVPAGATSGSVTVTLPGGTLSSNAVFTVTP
jgi:uncharacterized repeat protein (TIGR03803 family)